MITCPAFFINTLTNDGVFFCTVKCLCSFLDVFVFSFYFMCTKLKLNNLENKTPKKKHREKKVKLYILF